MTAVGQPAPQFKLPDEAGELHSLSELRASGPVVVYFYPRDHTPGCTKEACGFRDAHNEFAEAGAAVVGISADDADSHRSFRDRLDLPFLLLTDADGAVARAYGVKKTLGLIDGRATYVVDQKGIVRMVFSSQLQIELHVERALSVVRELAEAGRA
jgi:peroxiredoxin Q/BCP